jgi:histone-lysine N-methyltransferase SETMAR
LDNEGILLVEFLVRGAVVNSEGGVQTLKKLKQQIRRVWSNGKMNQVILHDSAGPHTSLRMGGGAIAAVGWSVLSHPVYSPDLAPSDSHLLGLLKDALQGCRFMDDKLQCCVREELKCFSKEFYVMDIAASHAKVGKVCW